MTQPSNHSPLLHPEWQTIEKISLQDFSSDDWTTLITQRAVYDQQEQARQDLPATFSSISSQQHVQAK